MAQKQKQALGQYQLDPKWRKVMQSERKDIRYIHKLRHEQSIDGTLLRKFGLEGYIAFIVIVCGFMGFVIGVVIH